MYEELRNEEIGVLSGMDADLVGGKEAPGLPVLKRSAKKKEIIECILRQWGWPTMKEVRKEKKIRQENWKRVDKRQSRPIFSFRRNDTKRYLLFVSLFMLYSVPAFPCRGLFPASR
jgi:hypothetical protein